MYISDHNHATRMRTSVSWPSYSHAYILLEPKLIICTHIRTWSSYSYVYLQIVIMLFTCMQQIMTIYSYAYNRSRPPDFCEIQGSADKVDLNKMPTTPRSSSHVYIRLWWLHLLHKHINTVGYFHMLEHTHAVSPVTCMHAHTWWDHAYAPMLACVYTGSYP